MFDDMISTGRLDLPGRPTILTERGAEKIYVAATHGVLCGPAIEKLAGLADQGSRSSPTRFRWRRSRSIPKIKVLSVAPLLGEAIKRIHRNESVSRLFD